MGDTRAEERLWEKGAVVPPSHQQVPTAVGPQEMQELGTHLSCHLALPTHPAPALAAMGRGVQMTPHLHDEHCPAHLQGLDCMAADGGGWWLDAARLEQAMETTTARCRARWAARAGGLFCSTVLLSLSWLRAAELENHSSKPQLPRHPLEASVAPFSSSSGWEVINSPSSPRQPPFRQDLEHGAGGSSHTQLPG